MIPNEQSRVTAESHAPVGHERRDLRCRDIVDHAISVQEKSTTMCAIEYLKSQNIPAHIIERVLLDPQRRRRALRH